MPYWQIVTRSFRIAWDHKYLWLLAFFSGEGGGSSFNNSRRTTGSTTTPPDAAAIQSQITTWVTDHIGLLVVLGLVSLALAIAFFILAAVCEAATIRGSAEHDAERPFGLRLAWLSGVHRMWAMVRFRLLLLALNVPIFLVVGAWFVGLIAAIANRSTAAVGPLVLSGLLILVAWLVYGTYLFFLDRLGSRALVLEELVAVPAIRRANSLVFKRLGRTLLVWLISIAVGLVVVFALAIALAPFVGLAVAAGSGAAIAVATFLAIAIVIALFLSGFIGAQGSTYWTLAFRRLDIDYPPTYAYPVTPPSPPTTQA